MINDGFARLARTTFRLFETKLFEYIFEYVCVCVRVCVKQVSFVSGPRPRALIRTTCRGYFCFLLSAVF